MNLEDLLGIDPRDPVDALAKRLYNADSDLIDQLIARRIALGISREKLAEAIGAPVSVVDRFEQGERDPRLSLVRHYALAVETEVRHSVARYDHFEATRTRSNEVLVEHQTAVWADIASRDEEHEAQHRTVVARPR
jgi:transcriptional regulator with XRE-family HTH domain